MPSNNELLALAERVEKGSGEDRELSGAVGRAVGWQQSVADNWYGPDGWARYPHNLLTSLDAVVALIEERLPGWVWEVRQIAKIEWRAGLGCLKSPRDAWFGEADTEVRARLACALRALTAQEPTT